MPANPIVLLDTSVFANLIRVPGRDSAHQTVRREFEERIEAGTRFILPITTLIETGNLIANANVDRRRAAERYVAAIAGARSDDPPWTIRDVAWDDAFLLALLAGDSTGSPLSEHLANGVMGGGDVAILVERDRLLAETAFTDISVWSLDGGLAAFGHI